MKKLLWFIPLALAYFIWDTLNDAGVFKNITGHVQGEVVGIYSNVPGPEDIDIDREAGILFISSTDRWNLHSREVQTMDGIYVINLHSTVPGEPQLLLSTLLSAFHPHGISFFKKEGTSYLLVVNHNETGDFIEKFEYKNDTLFHLKSFSSDLMCCPNDVVAVDTSRFYVTNDHGSPSGFSRKLEDYLRIPKSSVLYYDGNSFRKVMGGLNYANGINVSNDGRKLFVTETTSGLLNSYEINQKTGELNKTRLLNLHTGVDNISVGPEGNLLIGAHPRLFAFVGHAADKSKMSPSQVILLIPDGPDDFIVNDIYLDNGEQLSGSSVAVQFGNEVFIGVVFESKLLKMSLSR